MKKIKRKSITDSIKKPSNDNVTVIENVETLNILDPIIKHPITLDELAQRGNIITTLSEDTLMYCQTGNEGDSVTFRSVRNGVNISNKRFITHNFTLDVGSSILDEYIIIPSSSPINIECKQILAGQFYANFGENAISKTVKLTLDRTVIKTVPKIATASTVSSHSLVNAIGEASAIGGVTISSMSTEEIQNPDYSPFAGCFYDEANSWTTYEVNALYKHTVQLVFEGEYVEIEWRIWDDTGIFKPRCKRPHWYKGITFNNGSFLTKMEANVHNRLGGIRASTLTQPYNMSTNPNDVIRAGVDLGDILAEGHCLKYRLGMMIPTQTTPTCIDTGGTGLEWVKDAFITHMPISPTAIVSMGDSIYTKNSWLMYDNVSLSYMIVPMSNRVIKGYSEDKCTFNDAMQLAEYDSVLKHIHDSTATSTFTGVKTGIYTGGSLCESGNDYTGVQYSFYTPQGTVTTVMTNPIPSQTRTSDENRINAVYCPIFLCF